jgi:fatty acid desaturase
MRLFRYREDRIPIAIISLIFLCDLAAYGSIDSPFWLLVWTLVGIVPKGNICAWNHHHQHVPVFHVPLLNRLLEVIYGLHTGVTSHAWVLHHSLGHHTNYLDQEKDESRWRRASGGVMGELEYTLVVGFTSYGRAWKVGAKHPSQRRIFVWMGLLTLAVLGALAVHRPLPALFVFALPMVISLFLTAWATYSHHSGKPTDSHFVACNNIVHRGYNVVTGNLGYHTAHHYKPGVHWSRLPALHAQIASKIPADCYLTPGLPWHFGQVVTEAPTGLHGLLDAAAAEQLAPSAE